MLSFGERSRRWPGVLALALVLPLAGCATDADRPDATPPSSGSPGTSSGTGGDTSSGTGGGTGGGTGTATAAPGTREQLRVDGDVRQYLLHRPASTPASATADGPRPLVVAFHGRGADAAELRAKTRLEKAATARGMLVAFPEGLGHGWGAGTRATKQRPDPDLDVRFTEALIKHLIRTERADPERIYVAGFSNGGSMALRMAAERPALLAGAASVSGQLPTGDAAVEPTGPVPVMVVYGADDPVRPLAGLPTPPPDPEEPILPTRSARDTAAAFAQAGGAGEPVTREEKGYDRTVWRLAADAPGGDRRPDGTVQLLVVHDAGHTWPGSTVPPPEGFGPVAKAPNATDTILDFFADPGPDADLAPGPGR
ncbi:prolyl oligopeptidase family serine peptidase [Streptomyces sp. SID10362]|uniref:alpha/beta hydrolase family esterase n=1 Tax=Streptomyces sp. SID10362 TaxID=2706021 RepID=UPI0013C546F9|nr:PHB depolymerase family esterase [Streptomyces sp. SID10362]NDZ75818.1 prolyl oligopeptidase family serine peptidase [Streptomyces sp. SID10362]